MINTFTLLRRFDEHLDDHDHDHDHGHHHHHLGCGVKEDYDGNMGLRISSIFVIMLFSSLGVFFPLIVTKVKRLKISQPLTHFIKFFGTGIIIGTAFVHLLLPAFMELGSSPCLYGIWETYNFAPVLIMVGMLTIFLLELFSLRHISLKCAANSIDITSTSQTNISTDDKNPLEVQKSLSSGAKNDFEKQNLIKKYMLKKDLLTVIILEFGIIFHSIIIGFTLAVTGNKEFITLYIVISFHRKHFVKIISLFILLEMFEGLGLGARLFDIAQYNNLSYNILFAFIYSVITSVSIAIGLAAKALYNPTSPTAVIISGIFDSLSSGILLYAGLVELLAEDFIINSELRNGFVTMAIIGIWV
ncbi:unnamed protein product [Pneumocystis jirovecii]|uniref:Zinc/iron permease n=1 Tax=Pneumocystis jirovecii TaxID=42068 RepID=L0PAE6_PNEJI|nr:unnamed protein product [Pneumocystis jirovecii]